MADLFCAEGVRIVDAHCPGGRATYQEDEPIEMLALVFVRQGRFVREVGGRSALVDATAFYVERPATRQRIAHPAGPDVSTAIFLAPHLLGSLADPDGPLLPVAAPASPALDAAQRGLVARARRAGDPFALTEAAVTLGGRLLGGLVHAPDPAGRYPAAERWRRVVAEAQALLGSRLDLGLGDLARALGVSPFTLSRRFHAATGLTLSRYRRRLRARLAAERLLAGESDLAGLAAALGFADQSHMARAVRAEYGAPPGALRRRLEGAGTA